MAGRLPRNWTATHIASQKEVTVGERTSLIVPTFNDRETVEVVVQAGLASGADEVVVVDDGSPPSVHETIERLVGLERVRTVCCSANRGDGIARKIGAIYATGDILGFCDADLAMVKAEALRRLFEKVLSKEADLAIGALRYTDGKEPRLTTYLVAPLLKRFVPDLAQCVTSPLSGIRVVRRSYLYLERIEPRMCMLGMTLDAWRAGAHIAEVDIGVIENPKRSVAEKAVRADFILQAALRRFEEWKLIAIAPQPSP